MGFSASSISATIQSFQEFPAPSKEQCKKISEAIRHQDRSIEAAIDRVWKARVHPSSFIYYAILGKRWDSKLSAAIWESIPYEHLNSHCCNQALSSAAKVNFVTAKEIFQFTKENQLANFITYATFINAAGKNGALKEACDAFEEARRLNLADKVTYTSFINAAGKNGVFLEAKNAFEEAKKLKLANSVTYNSFIDAAGKNGAYQEARSAFEEAKRFKLADTITYASFIDAAGKNGAYQEVRSAFEEAKRLNLANTVTFNSFIDTAGKNGAYQEVRSAFEEAKRLNLADTVTYASFIDTAGKNGALKEARSAFEEARRLNLADTITFNSFIDAAGKNGAYQEARAIFLSIKDNPNHADVVSYNVFINIAGLNKQYGDVERAFKEAVSKKLADQTIYNVFLEYLILKPKGLEECKRVFRAGNLPIVIKIERGIPHIDTHNLSYGAAKILLHILLETEAFMTEGPFNIICGKGCMKDQNYLTCKKELQDYIRVTWPNADISDDPINLGQFSVNLKT